MQQLARAASAVRFGRARPFLAAPRTIDVPILSPSLKLFLATYCAGFVVVSAWIA